MEQVVLNTDKSPEFHLGSSWENTNNKKVEIIRNAKEN